MLTTAVVLRHNGQYESARSCQARDDNLGSRRGEQPFARQPHDGAHPMNTVVKLLLEVGTACAPYQDLLRNLKLKRIQLSGLIPATNCIPEILTKDSN